MLHGISVSSGSLAGASSIATLATATNLIVIIPTASVSAILGAISFVTGLGNKLLLNKIRKSEEMLATARSKLNSIEKVVTEAIDDMKITADEHILCLTEYESYLKLKREIRIKFNIAKPKSNSIKRDG